jgi:hypothetical protein
MEHQNNWMKLSFKIMSYIGYILVAGCGVKGKPLPPLTPPYIGSGQRVNAEINQPNKIEHHIVKNSLNEKESKDRK